MRGNRYAFLLSFTSILRAIGQHAKAVLEYQECTAHTRHIHTHPTRHQTSKRKKKVTKKRTTIYPNKLNYRRTTRQNKTAEAAKGVRRRQVVPSASLFFSLIFSAWRLLSFLLVVCFRFRARRRKMRSSSIHSGSWEEHRYCCHRLNQLRPSCQTS